jgi:hypothetical protein
MFHLDKNIWTAGMTVFFAACVKEKMRLALVLISGTT